MMKCNEVTRIAGAFLENRLRMRKRLAFLMHIAMCRGCRAYVEQLRLTIVGLRSLNRPGGATAPESLVQEFRRHAGKDRS